MSCGNARVGGILPRKCFSGIGRQEKLSPLLFYGKTPAGGCLVATLPASEKGAFRRVERGSLVKRRSGIEAEGRRPIACIIPPFLLERMAEAGDSAIRRRAVVDLAQATAVHAVRDLVRTMPSLLATPSPSCCRDRLIYDAGGSDNLPGRLVRREGDRRSRDPAVNEAYDHSGATYDFYSEVFGRNSLDDAGMTLISSVHAGEADGEGYQPMNNAFWNGSQMAYGDGDGLVFGRFTQALDVVAHELTHGVQSFTSNLVYRGESGALNEHFADVFGVLVRQWSQAGAAKRGRRKEGASTKDRKATSRSERSWLIGAELVVPAATRRAVRDMQHPGTAFVNDPLLGTDPQPAHWKDRYRGTADRGGVHINSGIANRAFVLAAEALDDEPWQTAGRIWYDTMLEIPSRASFADAARVTTRIARDDHGAVAAEAVREAWKAVGVKVSAAKRAAGAA
jgi:Zn-dependent metalloprotease